MGPAPASSGDPSPFLSLAAVPELAGRLVRNHPWPESCRARGVMPQASQALGIAGTSRSGVVERIPSLACSLLHLMSYLAGLARSPVPNNTIDSPNEGSPQFGAIDTDLRDRVWGREALPEPPRLLPGMFRRSLRTIVRHLPDPRSADQPRIEKDRSLGSRCNHREEGDHFEPRAGGNGRCRRTGGPGSPPASSTPSAGLPAATFRLMSAPPGVESKTDAGLLPAAQVPSVSPLPAPADPIVPVPRRVGT